MVRVIADDVALLGHAPHQSRLVFQIVAHHEERRRGIMGLEDVENLLRLAAFVAGVKGQVEDRLFVAAHIGRVVLPEHLRADGACGRLALLLKAQAPGPGLHRAARQQQPHTQCRQQRCRHRQPLPNLSFPGSTEHGYHLHPILWDKPGW